MSALKIIYGVPYPTLITKDFQDVLERYNVNELDTGASYPGSERGIGDARLSERFVIHTKSIGYKSGTQDYQGILDSAHESARRLGSEQFETYFLHTPDPASPLPRTLDAIQKLHQAGLFKHFGLSNFLPEQVKEVYEYCLSKGYVLPTVYEGSYNPVGRHAETKLIPLLRKLNIRFIAYAILAGGFLTKTPEYFTSNGQIGTRWDPDTQLGQRFNSIYNRPKLLLGLDKWNEVAAKFGIPAPALSYRWTAYNSLLSAEYGDGLIIGATSPEQLAQSLEWLKDGPLDETVVADIDLVWETVESDAAFDNFNLCNHTFDNSAS